MDASHGEPLRWSEREDKARSSLANLLLETVEKVKAQVEMLALLHDREVASLRATGGLRPLSPRCEAPEFPAGCPHALAEPVVTPRRCVSAPLPPIQGGHACGSDSGVIPRGASGLPVMGPLAIGRKGPTCGMPLQVLVGHSPAVPPRAERIKVCAVAAAPPPSAGPMAPLSGNVDEAALTAEGNDLNNHMAVSEPDTNWRQVSVSFEEPEPLELPIVSRTSSSRRHMRRLSNAVETAQAASAATAAYALEAMESWHTVSTRISQETAAATADTLIGQVVLSSAWEPFFGLVILVSCVVMGLEAQILVRGKPQITDLLESLEHVFNFLFTFELAARIYVFGWRKFAPSSSDNAWNLADAVLVMVTSVIFGIVLAILRIVGFKEEPGSDIIRVLAVLRAFRLMRLIRVVQRVELFHEAWLLLRGLGDSGRTLLWTIVVIFFITYVFAVFGMVLIAKRLQMHWDASMVPGSDSELSEQEMLDFLGFQEYFLSLDSVMMTLVQLLTLDSWNSMVRPLVRYVPWCWCYFYTYIAVGVFVLMNLVTAIIVENALSSSKNDEERKLLEKDKETRQEVAKLHRLFHAMDTDGDGTLSWGEFQASFADPKTADKWRLLDFKPEDCAELFRLLDTGDGSIDTEEFFDGLRRTKGMAQSKDVFRVQKTIERLDANIAQLRGISSPASPSAGPRPSLPMSPLGSSERRRPPAITDIYETPRHSRDHG